MVNILHTGFFINPNFHNVEFSLGINFFKSFFHCFPPPVLRLHALFHPKSI
ncbi:hypothetical protein SAMD00023520_02082 [Listeria monocytogenes]|nr:hypothetical protein SAMD00023520_02082 [Listeria monocytogenes]